MEVPTLFDRGDKMSELDEIIKQINKKKEIIFRGADLMHQTFLRQSTGSLSFDLALGGGFPLNCVNEVIGNESSGKTSMVTKTIAHQQSLNPEHHTLWVASEDFDFDWAQTLSADPARITFVNSNIMEEAYEVCIRVMTQRAVDAVVIDSLPALMPDEEYEKRMDELTVGRGAMLTNKFMRKAISAAGRSLTEDDRPVLCLVINQWRDTIGQMGEGRTTPGGKGKNYTYMTRSELSRIEWLKDASVTVGQVIKMRTIKNKTAPPRREGQVDFYFQDAKGHVAGEYDTAREVWEIATLHEVLERKGAWYHFGKRKWNGKDAVWAAMQDDPSLIAAFDTAVRAFVLGEEPPPAAAPKRRRARV